MKPSPKAIAANPRVAAGKKHVLCGAGGSRAILAGAGHITACWLSGISTDDWDTIGGISGGSVPTALLAGGVTPPQLLRFAVEVDFSSLVPRHATPLTTILAFLLKDRFEKTRPKRGVLSSDNLGKFIDQWVPTWPEKYWTMAAVGHTQVLFTAKGVFQYLPNGQYRVLSDKPAPVGLAVRASCAIPGIIDAVPFKGYYLHDGALSWDGQCPVNVLPKHFGAESKDIIAMDVGDDNDTSRWSRLVHKLWSAFCGGHCVGHSEPAMPPADVVMCKPNVWSVSSLQFTLNENQKWQAVLSGYEEAIAQLKAAGLIPADRLEACLAVCGNVEKLKALAA